MTNTTVLLEPRFTMAGEEGKVATSIRAKLTERFKPEHLEVNSRKNLAIPLRQVINESYMHNVPKGSETHFKVVVVSPEFNEVNAKIFVNIFLTTYLLTNIFNHTYEPR